MVLNEERGAPVFHTDGPSKLLGDRLGQAINYRQDTRTAFGAQQPASGRCRQLNARAAQIAHGEALKDAKRALRACHPQEVADLRQSSALLFGFAKSLTGGAR